MLEEQRTLTIGQAASELGVSPSWLRFGERLGSLPLARRTAGGWRYYTPEDIERLHRLGVGERKRHLTVSAEQEKVRAYLDHVSQGREWIGEFINVRRNGETYQVESTVSPISDIAGRFMGYVICERDITMRQQLQDALRVEHDFVQSILQSLDGAIYSLDCEFRLTHANDGWRHLPAEHLSQQSVQESHGHLLIPAMRRSAHSARPSARPSTGSRPARPTSSSP